MHAVIWGVLVGCVLLAPLPYGANRPWSWSLCAVMVGLLALTWALGTLRTPRGSNPGLSWIAVVPFVLVCGWILVQTHGVPSIGETAAIWHETGIVLGAPLIDRISIAPDASLTALMRLVTYALVLVLAVQLAEAPGRAGRVYFLLVGIGALYAAFALWVGWGGAAPVWFDGGEGRGRFSGTFINPNNLATYLGMVLIVNLAVLARQWETPRRSDGPIGETRVSRIEGRIRRLWLPLTALLVVSSALLSTLSRAGVVSVLMGCGTFFVLVSVRRRRRRAPLIAGIGLFFAGVFANSTFSDRLLDRLTRTVWDASQREHVYGLIADAVRDNPVPGYGYGAFASAFRLIRDEAVTGYFDKAHNTYLENAFELGLPGGVLLLIAIGVLVVQCARGLFRVSRPRALFPIVALAVTVQVGFHALADFSLQIPAIAMTYALILGIGVAHTRQGKPSSQEAGAA